MGMRRPDFVHPVMLQWIRSLSTIARFGLSDRHGQQACALGCAECTPIRSRPRGPPVWSPEADGVACLLGLGSVACLYRLRLLYRYERIRKRVSFPTKTRASPFLASLSVCVLVLSP